MQSENAGCVELAYLYIFKFYNYGGKLLWKSIRRNMYL